MSKRKSLVLGLILLSAGCARTATYSTVYLPNGTPGGTITCHYRSECLREATRVCAGAYTIISGEDNNPHVVNQDGENSYLIPTSDFNPSSRGTEYILQCSQHHGDGT